MDDNIYIIRLALTGICSSMLGSALVQALNDSLKSAIVTVIVAVFLLALRPGS